MEVVEEVYWKKKKINHKKFGPTPPRLATPVLKSALELRGVVDQYSYFGFSAKTKQLNCVIPWKMMVVYYPENKGTQLKILPGVLIPVVVLVAAVIAAGLVYYRRRKKSERSNSGILDALTMLPGMPREFLYKDLNKAMNSFDEKNKLGHGGFRVVYERMIQEDNLEVAVKIFSGESLKGSGRFLGGADHHQPSPPQKLMLNKKINHPKISIS